jgi:peptidyl-prolyl cis-trans isomerase B (cyclophilin B)
MLRQFSKQLKMKKVQEAFNQLASQHHDEIMQLRRDRNRAGLQELQDKLAAQAEAMVTADGLTPEQIKTYSTIGGTPHLDGQYTVFGEVEQGLEVVEQIQNTKTSQADRPSEDIQMTVTVIES